MDRWDSPCPRSLPYFPEIFMQRVPSVSGTANLLDILDRVKQLDVSIYIPGHGPTGSLEEISLLQQYITAILQLSKELHGDNKPIEEARKVAMPAPFDSWEASEVVSWNMEFLYERLIRP